MTPENIRYNAGQEWNLSEEAYTEAETLNRAGLRRGALTRYYYAAFHAVRAALLTRSVEPTTHSGTRSEFSRAFVRTALVSRDVARALTSLQKEREEADCSRAFLVDDADADEAREAASTVRNAIEALLRAEGWL